MGDPAKGDTINNPFWSGGSEFQTFCKVGWDGLVGKGRWIRIWGGHCAVALLSEKVLAC